MKKYFLNNCKALTLMELMIVIVLISIIAGFALPNYRRSLDRAHERDAVKQLQSIHAANLIWLGNTTVYWAGPGNDADQINAGLNLNVIPNKFNYVYTRTNPTTYSATATFIGTPAFRLRVNQGPLIAGTNPCCTTGNCPSVPNC